MRLDLVPSEHWESLNDFVKAELHLADELSCRTFSGAGPALFESAVGLAQVYSHKRALGVLKGNSPLFESVTPWFLKEAYQMQTATLSDLQKKSAPGTLSALEEWARALKKETFAVLWSEDHPVTGETWDFDAFDELLNELKIFSLRLSHARFIQDARGESLRPMSLRILSLSGDLAVSVAGARYRVPPLTAQLKEWKTPVVLSQLRSRLAEPLSDFLIEEFEKNFPTERFFQPGQKRVQDRAVLVFRDLNGDALVKALRREMNLPEDAHLLDTSSLCRWQMSRSVKNWWLPPPSEDELRGLVLFSPALLERQDLIPTLRSVCQKIQSLQSW